MKIDCTLTWLLFAMSPLAALGCGMDAAGSADSNVAGTPAASDHPAAGPASAAPLDGDAAATDSATSVAVGADSGTAADGGAPASCHAPGVTCKVTSDCCAGLACTGEDEDRRCK